MAKTTIQEATGQTTQIAAKEEDATKLIMRQYIRQMEGEIKKALPSILKMVSMLPAWRKSGRLRHSKAYENGPWQTNFEEMAKKTVLKRILKYAPLKSDFLRGITQDETIKTEISEDMYTVPADVIEVTADIDEVRKP